MKELKTGQASVGAGYSSSGGFMGFVEVGDTNFLGRGGSLTLGRPISTYTELTAGIKIENVQNQGEAAPSAGGRTHSLQLDLNTNTTDYPCVPTTGFRNSLLLEFAGGLLRGDAEFSKYEDQLVYYHKVGASGQVLALRVAAGVGTGNVPEQEQFLVGGADTVRGYEYGANQGTKMLVLNAEYRFSLAAAWAARSLWTAAGPGRSRRLLRWMTSRPV